jgi:hypothetical protein
MVARQAVDEDRFCETITQAADKIFVFINPGKPFSTQKQILNLKNAEKLTVIFHSWFYLYYKTGRHSQNAYKWNFFTLKHEHGFLHRFEIISQQLYPTLKIFNRL